MSTPLSTLGTSNPISRTARTDPPKLPVEVCMPICIFHVLNHTPFAQVGTRQQKGYYMYTYWPLPSLAQATYAQLFSRGSLANLLVNSLLADRMDQCTGVPPLQLGIVTIVAQQKNDGAWHGNDNHQD